MGLARVNAGVRAALAAVLVALAAAPAPARAEERTLYWADLAVDARLDADGRLHVRERHVMVFDGTWNGGYRRFNVRFGQDLDLERLTRVDPGTGKETPVVEGDLDVVNNYAWQEGNELRWRSRLPEDPPFVREALTYDIEYTLAHILLVNVDDTFILDHDFAFPDRDGPIERFALRLAIDPVWQAENELPTHLVREQLQPGDSVLVGARFRYAGTGTPAAVTMPVPPGLQSALVAALLLGVAGLAVLFYRREQALGRFAAVPSPRAIDEAWLREHLLPFLPEEAGAAWDDAVGPPEVAALLARLVGEGKIESRIELTKIWFLTQEELHLRLTVPGDELERSHERALIAALFQGDEVTTSTARIRKRYQRTGFDPASKIREPLAKSLRRHLDMRETRPRPPLRPVLVLLAIGMVLVALGVWLVPPSVLAVAAFCGFGVVPFVIAIQSAVGWRKRIMHPLARTAFFILPLLFLCWLFARLRFSSDWAFFVLPHVSIAVLAGLAISTLAGCAHVFRLAATRDGPRKLERRRCLGAARAFLRAELRAPEPRLRDEWFPYVVAFGLGHAAERWFRRFGAASGSTGAAVASGGSRSGSRGGEAATWTGGGGKFGGGGAGGSWVAAVGTVAAGVAAPSKSGSGGGGGGGGSSGGGGGGGW
jgi:uncharacterized membrane protein YgcG